MAKSKASMTARDIENANVQIRDMREMIGDVLTAARTTKNDYAEALAGVVSDCLARLVISRPRIR